MNSYNSTLWPAEEHYPDRGHCFGFARRVAIECYRYYQRLGYLRELKGKWRWAEGRRKREFVPLDPPDPTPDVFCQTAALVLLGLDTDEDHPDNTIPGLLSVARDVSEALLFVNPCLTLAVWRLVAAVVRRRIRNRLHGLFREAVGTEERHLGCASHFQALVNKWHQRTGKVAYPDIRKMAEELTVVFQQNCGAEVDREAGLPLYRRGLNFQLLAHAASAAMLKELASIAKETGLPAQWGPAVVSRLARKAWRRLHRVGWSHHLFQEPRTTPFSECQSADIDKPASGNPRGVLAVSPKDDIEDELKHLDPKQKQAVEHRYGIGGIGTHTFEEIGGLQGTKKSAAEKRVKNAIQKLRQLRAGA
jgi:DNA-directed RNA polymerase specialized sigma24 family protein